MPPITNSVWLISGIPGAGKTTVSRMLCEEFPKSAHIEVDRLREMVVAGYLAPGQELLAESDAQLELGAQNAALLADALSEQLCIPYQLALMLAVAAAAWIPAKRRPAGWTLFERWATRVSH